MNVAPAHGGQGECRHRGDLVLLQSEDHEWKRSYCEVNPPGETSGLALKQRVADELKTTFASHYSGAISLPEALQPDAMAAYGQRATGAKYLINPSKGMAT